MVSDIPGCDLQGHCFFCSSVRNAYTKVVKLPSPVSGLHHFSALLLLKSPDKRTYITAGVLGC